MANERHHTPCRTHTLPPRQIWVDGTIVISHESRCWKDVLSTDDEWRSQRLTATTTARRRHGRPIPPQFLQHVTLNVLISGCHVGPLLLILRHPPGKPRGQRRRLGRLGVVGIVPRAAYQCFLSSIADARQVAPSRAGASRRSLCRLLVDVVTYPLSTAVP